MFVIKFIFCCRLSLQQTPSSTIILIIWVCLKIGYDMLWLSTNSWLKNVNFLCQNDHLCGKQPHFQTPFPLLLLPPHQSAMPLPACQSPSRVQQVSGFKILTAAGGWTSPQHSMDWLTGNHLQLCFKGFPEKTTIIQFSRYVGFLNISAILNDFSKLDFITNSENIAKKCDFFMPGNRCGQCPNNISTNTWARGPANGPANYIKKWGC